MKRLVNLTPHVISLNSGLEIQPSGTVVRVAAIYTSFDEDGVCEAMFGEVQGLPEPQDNTLYIVSAIVAQVAKRPDVVSPAVGHPATVRKEGQPWSVPGFVRVL
jgi:hypothetical protein